MYQRQPLDLTCVSPGVNFTNILRAAFIHTDHKKCKKDSQVKQLLALFGSACVNAVHKHIDEIDPRFRKHEHHCIKGAYSLW